ncbi:electron transport complex subunit RsxG [Stutzerimonas stutzeri]|jgi:Na+-translocating ferredoxin:NAD+ oxidoreductase subunit G|uniref:Ion-translocating oxidoreductase complex subunit G n=1 Tax=Stutzerimonas stutzeri TaxID=316 RepID=A0ABD4Y203_STUST|nr:electron transport complex subunit RsxG [Stutzerimonas stutzeri]HAG21301.1 electron transport complex subunit RsxG [Pseudomonas sp.]MDH0083235.1 electron transport complex subunit RsxG [Stutzerimonas stutzeri]MDH0688502.1 electron transport complex subunit RsxG [Stutzerimonas stutzeri]OSO72175.1 electron transport complex subunit RsxG [Stutzerimonas stutzeri]UUC84649.1 electron transport complex subunit RsxG [Stutzerimonas stutzeri]
MIVPEISRSMLKNATVLGLFAIVTVGAVTLLQQGTAERIQAAERAAQVRALGEILPTGSYDNHLLDDSVLVQDRLLGNRSPLPAYIAIKDGRPSAVILQAIAPDGYSGAIHLLVGIHADGRVAGVRVIGHRETPGLGDKIELAKSPWIRSFEGKSLTNPAADGWAVKKDRGEFDQFAGATITPRAVVGAVHRALQYFDAHKAELLAAEGATADAAGNALEGRSEPDEATVHSRAGSAATRDELRTTEPAAKPQGDQP